ncbi:hypothetical protein [Paenibacillus sp. NFR01]|uniref:hypothetical protein n=1 Tax=Paenibacillus sp. NFR01 TaxID=1566279 RepID=UPI0008B84CCC|nr:hypothetical protein [Paenibacillus sp. NFR01]SET17766.1 hypothetical protein SAMN03159358_0934 [Paenibacillus sp. NFR01]
MGQGYVLVNQSKGEIISFSHLPASKARELTGNPVTAAMTTWYLLRNIGNQISFMEEENVPLGYCDVTNLVINDLIRNDIIEDRGIEVIDSNEPEIFIRQLRNKWMDC